jgi:hypothetical protein
MSSFFVKVVDKVVVPEHGLKPPPGVRFLIQSTDKVPVLEANSQHFTLANIHSNLNIYWFIGIRIRQV